MYVCRVYSGAAPPFAVTGCATLDRLNLLDLVDPNGPSAADNAAAIVSVADLADNGWVQ